MQSNILNIKFFDDDNIEILKQLLADGFKINDDFFNKIRSVNALKLCISYYPNIINNYIKPIDNENSEEIIKYALKCGYLPSLDVCRINKLFYQSEIILLYLIENNIISNKFLNEYQKINNIKGLTLEIVDKIWNLINYKGIMHLYNYNYIIKIIKFVYLNEDETFKLYENLEIILRKNKLENFKLLVDNLYEYDNFNDKLIFMNNISDNYLYYEEFFNNININELYLKDKYLIKRLLLSKDKYNINSLDDLYKLEKIKYNELNDYINEINYSTECIDVTEYAFNNQTEEEKELGIDPEIIEYTDFVYTIKNKSILKLQNIILRMLCNMNYEEYIKTIYNGFKINDIDKLDHLLNSKKLKHKLNIFKECVEFLDEVLNCRNFNHLKKLALDLNKYFYYDKNYVIETFNALDNIEYEKKLFYSLELKNNLFDYNRLNENKKNELGYIRINNKYVSSNMTIFGEDISNRKVDYIEMQGVEFVSLVHVMNAYGTGGTLENYKKSRIVGKSYICLTAISNEKVKYAENNILSITNENEKINYVTLIFGNIDISQLISMSDEDIGVYAENNSLNITNVLSSYKLIGEQISTTNDYYNEYDFYREDNLGNIMYPTGILISEPSPTQYEIDAAAYLNIPLIYINFNYYRKQSFKHFI